MPLAGIVAGRHFLQEVTEADCHVGLPQQLEEEHCRLRTVLQNGQLSGLQEVYQSFGDVSVDFVLQVIFCIFQYVLGLFETGLVPFPTT